MVIKQKIKKYLTNKIPEIVFFLLILLGLILFNKLIDNLIYQHWYSIVLKDFSSNSLFDIVLVTTVVLVSYKTKDYKWSKVDSITILIYSWFRFYNESWEYIPIFSANWLEVSYIDLIALYYVFRISYKYKQISKWFKKDLKRILTKDIQPVYTDGLLVTDIPLNIESERTGLSIDELDKNGLNRNKFAQQIADVIEQIHPKKAYAIGICGPWGAGKTSLVSLIIKNLDCNKRKDYLLIEFSPWFFNSSESLILSFFSAIESKFPSNRILAAELRAYSKQIAAIEKSLIKTEFIKVFDKERSLKERYNNICNEIESENRPLLITIDDIDRLDKKEVIEILRLIRLLAEFPNTIYIVSYDREYVESAIEQELTRYNPGKYVDKVFNVEYKIPELEPGLVQARFKNLITKQLQYKNINHIDNHILEKCINYEAFHRFIRNERDIKRFTNNILMRFLSIKDDINFYHFFLLELIYYKEPIVITKLYERRIELFKWYKEHSGSSMNFGNILGIEKINDDINTIISILFDKNAKTEEHSIANQISFYRYFSLSLLAKDFTEVEFQNLFNKSLEVLQGKLVEYNSINAPLLYSKLYQKFNNLNIKTDNDLKKVIHALFHLYNSISENISSYSENDLNGLGRLIIHILYTSGKDVTYLQQMIPLFTFNYPSSIQNFLSIKNIPIYLKNGNENLTNEFKEQFKQILFSVLEENVRRNNVIDAIKNIEQLCEHIVPHVDSIHAEWFLNSVIIEHKQFIVTNLDKIIDYIKSIIDKQQNATLESYKLFVNRIFYNIDLTIYDDGFDKIKALAIGYNLIQTIPFTFVNNSLEQNNDSILSDVFKFTSGLKIEVQIFPTKKPFWRFGFRLSKNREFPPIAINKRHIEGYPFIHLSKGDLNLNDAIVKHPLRLDIYSGEGYDTSQSINGHIEKLPIHFSIEYTESMSIILRCCKTILELRDYKQYHFTQLSAWADYNEFSIDTKINILQKI